MPILLGLWLVFGVVGYREAAKVQQQYGRGPWGGSALLWGFVCFLLGIFGALLLLIAVKNSKKQYEANANMWNPAPYADPRFPAPPPANQWAPPPPVGWRPPPPPPSAPGGPNDGGTDFIPRS